MGLVTTPKGTPAGIKLKDGHPTTIVFLLNPTVSLWEKNVKPPGFDGGASVEQTTMLNVLYRTMAPRILLTATEVTGKAAYDPRVLEQLKALINKETCITVHFPDNSTVDFFGYLQKFDPQEHSEGNQPEANYTIVPTNVDPVTGAETAPNYKSPSGTDI